MLKDILVVHSHNGNVKFYRGVVTPDEFKGMKRDDTLILSYIKYKDPMPAPYKLTSAEDCHILLIQE